MARVFGLVPTIWRDSFPHFLASDKNCVFVYPLHTTPKPGLCSVFYRRGPWIQQLHKTSNEITFPPQLGSYALAAYGPSSGGSATHWDNPRTDFRFQPGFSSLNPTLIQKQTIDLKHPGIIQRTYCVVAFRYLLTPDDRSFLGCGGALDSTLSNFVAGGEPTVESGAASLLLATDPLATGGPAGATTNFVSLTPLEIGQKDLATISAFARTIRWTILGYVLLQLLVVVCALVLSRLSPEQMAFSREDVLRAAAERRRVVASHEGGAPCCGEEDEDACGAEEAVDLELGEGRLSNQEGSAEVEEGASPSADTEKQESGQEVNKSTAFWPVLDEPQTSKLVEPLEDSPEEKLSAASFLSQQKTEKRFCPISTNIPRSSMVSIPEDEPLDFGSEEGTILLPEERPSPAEAGASQSHDDPPACAAGAPERWNDDALGIQLHFEDCLVEPLPLWAWYLHCGALWVARTLPALLMVEQGFQFVQLWIDLPELGQFYNPRHLIVVRLFYLCMSCVSLGVLSLAHAMATQIGRKTKELYGGSSEEGAVENLNRRRTRTSSSTALLLPKTSRKPSANYSTARSSPDYAKNKTSRRETTSKSVRYSTSRSATSSAEWRSKSKSRDQKYRSSQSHRDNDNEERSHRTRRHSSRGTGSRYSDSAQSRVSQRSDMASVGLSPTSPGIIAAMEKLKQQRDETDAAAAALASSREERPAATAAVIPPRKRKHWRLPEEECGAKQGEEECGKGGEGEKREEKKESGRTGAEERPESGK